MVASSTEYERLVRDVYEGLLRQDRFENVEVQHNVRLLGRSGTHHQIDVLWEFKAAGVQHRACIECRHYAGAIKQGQMAAFAEVLRDVGPAAGIMVTTAGFQPGAQKIAGAHGIRLVLVNYLIREIHVHMKPHVTSYDKVNLRCGETDLARVAEVTGRATPQFLAANPDEMWLVDEERTPRQRLRSLLQHRGGESGHFVVPIDDGLYVETDGGLLRVEALEFDRSVREIQGMDGPSFVIGGPHLARAIVEDLTGNETFYLHDGTDVRAATARMPSEE